jgi:hypothetical protein
MASLIEIWQTMSTEQQLAWQAYASTQSKKNKLGVKYKPSAYHAFLGVNARLINNGAVGVLVPPATSNSLFQYPFVIDIVSSTDAQVTFMNALGSGQVLCLKATRSLSNGVRPSTKDFSTIYFSNTQAAAPQDVNTQYVNAFGAAITGRVVWMLTIITDVATGQQSPTYVQSYTVV